MGGPGSGRRRSGGGPKRPQSFSLNVNKMRSVKMPKNVKKAGINSESYKNWIYKNWT